MNKYLEKIASLHGVAEGVKAVGKDFAKGWKRSSTTSKIGLGMSATGLSLGAANYKNSVESKNRGKNMADIGAKSLLELKGISEALKKKPKVTVNLKLTPSQEKQAGLGNAVRNATFMAKRNPLIAAGMVVGGADGAMRTTHKKNESYAKTILRGVRNTTVGAAAGGAVGAMAEKLVNR